MTREVRIIAAPDAARGFELAGLTTAIATDGDTARALLEDFLRQQDVGVVLVDDRFYAALPDELRAELARRPLPLVVPFPRPRWGEALEAAEAYVVELLRRAIGYRVKLA